MKSLILLLICTNIFAQSSSELKIAYIQEPVAEFEKLTLDQIKRYENKVLSALTKQAISTMHVRNSIVLSSQLLFVNEQTLNPGTQTLYVIDGDLNLILKQGDNNLVFNNYTQRIKGSGRNWVMAYNNLISNIDLDNSEFTLFVKNSKTKIFDYYNKNCDLVLKQAGQLEKTNQFEESLALIMTIPMETSCYKSANQQLENTFKNYQNKNCKILLQKAESLLANNEYDLGFQYLSAIDPLSPCAQEVKKIIAKQSNEKDILRDKSFYWKFLNQAYTAQITAEVLRFNSINSILGFSNITQPYYYR